MSVSREIKFRFYHKSFGMSAPVTLKEIHLNDDHRCWALNPKPIILQYTGLKDKNGVDICEGDIILILDQYYYRDIKVPVVYSKGGFRAEFGSVYSLTDRGDKNICQVIGNIYENPELLENNK